MRAAVSARTLFITGTDTGVGKTVITALLLSFLREGGINAAAMKPFSTGERNDVRRLQPLQAGDVTMEKANPYHFSKPGAPLVAIVKTRSGVLLSDVMRAIKGMQRGREWLLIEGIGGLLVPLGRNYTVADLVSRIGCPVVVVARNRLGTINHTLLTVRVLRQYTSERVVVVLNNSSCGDNSSATNGRVLREFLPGVEVLEVPYLGEDVELEKRFQRPGRKLKKTLARFFQGDNLSTFFRMESGTAQRKRNR